MSESFKVTVKATSIEIQDGANAMYMLSPLIDMLTYEDEFAEETKTLGFIYDEETDTLYLHKGVDLKYLQRLLVNMEVIYKPYDQYKPMRFEYEEVIAPRDKDQVDVINFIAGLHQHAGNINESQLFLVKKPGFGKAQPYSTKIPTPMRRTMKSTIMKVVGTEFKSVPVEYEVNMDYVRMGDLKVGDYIFDRKGRPTVVTSIFDRGELDVYKITFEDGRTALCCLEHLWGVFVDNNPKYKVLDTCEMIEMLKQNQTLSIPLCKPAQFSEKPYVCYEGSPRDVIYNNLKDSFVYSSPQAARKCLDGRNVREYLDPEKEYTFEEADKDFANDIYLPLLYQMGYKAYYKDGQIHYSYNGKLKIESIEYSHREQCRCIMVDNPEHLYLTEDFIVTHNTYCSGVGMCLWKTKTLIISHRDDLRKQWLNSLYNMSGLSSKEVHEIHSSEELYAIAHNDIKLNYDVYLMTHATFRAGMKRIGHLKDAMNITKNLGVGMKIIDEAHLEFRDTLLMDVVFNVKRNIYLTATDGRSSKDENSIFRHVFSNTLFYKPSSLLSDDAPKKWVEYISVCVNSHCNPNIYRYRVAGGRGMNPASYGKWVIQYDKKDTHFNCCLDILKIMYEKDQYAKVLLFMPLIDLCEECAYFLKKKLGMDKNFNYDLDIRTINSKNSKKDNDYAKHTADVIITTIASCGTGTDIPGITGIISCSPFVSGITAEQVFGRIRYCGKVCQYYDIYDSSVQLDVFWWKSRSKKLKHLALNTATLYWTPDEE